MTTSAGVGFSDHRNPAQAGRDAALQALGQAGTAKPDFVFVFATVGYNQQALLRAIREVTAGAPLSGCSGEGIITRETVSETNFGVAVMVISSAELRFNHAMIQGIGGKAGQAGERLAGEIRPFLAPDNIACFLLADGLVFNFDPFLSAFEAGLRQAGQAGPLPLFGGLAADNWASHKTYQYHNDEVFSEGLSCVVMSGSGGIASGVNHGCVPVGGKRTITRSQGNIIYEIDGMPALDALQDYLGEDWRTQWNKTSLNVCLGFKTPAHLKHGYEEYIIRYMMGKDDEQGGVTIQSEVSEGTELWIVRRDKELIACGMQAISGQIREQLAGRTPRFVLQFECVGRGKVVFREQEKLELIRGLQQEIGENVPWIGLYTYGEIGPVVSNNCFHNFTSVVTAVY
jgi:hypothetical protein